MMNMQVITAATSIPYGSATHHAAIDLCIMRGLDPHANRVDAPFPIENWRFVIAETMLAALLARELAI